MSLVMGICTWISVQLRPQQAVTVAVVLLTLSLPEMWGCYNDADADFCLVG